METNFDTVSTSHIWMDPAENETVIDINDEVQWYIFNIQSTGKIILSQLINDHFSLDIYNKNHGQRQLLFFIRILQS